MTRDQKRNGPVVLVRLKGGLGNQMFCYAAARSLALRLGGDLRIDIDSGFRYDVDYRRTFALGPFRLPAEHATPWQSYAGSFGRVRRRLDRRRQRSLQGPRVYFSERVKSFDTRWPEIAASQLVYLDGYFQSPQYFEDHADTIRSDFDLAPPVDRSVLDQIAAARRDGRTPVAVGVRLYEEAKDGAHPVEGVEFYREALATLSIGQDQRRLFLFTSNPDAAVPLLDPAEDVIVVQPNRSNEGVLADLAVMASCDHFVISNSSYYWWAAWLSRAEGKEVVASSSFSNVDIHPSGWSVVDELGS